MQPSPPTSDPVSGFACVRCGAGLDASPGEWRCQGCATRYPVLGGLPWLFRDPADALSGWRLRCDALRVQLRERAAALGSAATASGARPLTRQRLSHLAAAFADQADRLERLLRPLGLVATLPRGETLQALGTPLPLEQGLVTYSVNLHRDWCWGDAENAAQIGEVHAALGEAPAPGPGRTLVLGAGAGRLAFDLARAWPDADVVATDVSPLLLAVAQEMLAGRSLELYEFPIAPRGLLDGAVLRTLQAPEALRSGLRLVLADALDAPFAAGAWDTVVTPWFVDVIGEPLVTLGSRINAWLRPGGRWINTGSLAFNLPDAVDQLGVEEAVAAVATAGFDVDPPREARLPYMQSPASRHARLETVVTWCATKVRDSDVPPPRALPAWLRDPRLPVPRSAALEFQQVTSRIHAFLLALVNGERSIADMARAVVEQKLLPPDEAEAAVRRFLRRETERTQRRSVF